MNWDWCYQKLKSYFWNCLISSKIRYWNRQSFSTVCTFETIFDEVSYLFYCVVAWYVLNILVASLRISMHLTSQTAYWTPSRAPAPAIPISHYVTFGFHSGNRKKVLKISTRYAMDCKSFRKNILSSAKAKEAKLK